MRNIGSIQLYSNSPQSTLAQSPAPCRSRAGVLPMRTLCIILSLFAVPAVADEPKVKPPDDKKPVEEKVNEIAGTAEVLRSFPKHYAVLKSIDAANGKVTLLIDGEKL